MERRVLPDLGACLRLPQSLSHLPQPLGGLPESFTYFTLFWERALVADEEGLLHLVLIYESFFLDLLKLLKLIVADLVPRLRGAVLAVVVVFGAGTHVT